MSPVPQIKMTCDCPQVLIVDDDVFNLTALSQILAKNAVGCHWAFHGKEAIEIVKYRQANRCGPQCQQYKAIFLDLSMLILNGFETAKHGIWFAKFLLEIDEDDKVLLSFSSYFSTKLSVLDFKS